jgi:hypothetical protein
MFLLIDSVWDQRLRWREAERDNGDQKRNLLVLSRRMMRLLGSFHALVRAHGALPAMI